MSEVVDKPDAATKDIVAKAIKNAQRHARESAKKPEPDKWLVDWTLYCTIIPLETVTAQAKKVGPNEWEGIEPVVFSAQRACMMVCQPQWMANPSQRINLREKLKIDGCIRNIKIHRWGIRIVDGQVEIRVDMDGETNG